MHCATIQQRSHCWPTLASHVGKQTRLHGLSGSCFRNVCSDLVRRVMPKTRAVSPIRCGGGVEPQVMCFDHRGRVCNDGVTMELIGDETCVLLVDDHAVVRAGYRRLLTSAADIRVTGEADSGEKACRLLAERSFDVVVMDISLPGISGVAACSRITRDWPDTRVLMFSVHEEVVYVRRALQAGAVGYLTKRAVAEMLVHAVREVAAGRNYLEPEMMIAATDDDPLACLSRREFEIFRLLAEGNSVQSIADHLFLSSKTVSNHASRIRAKLGVASAADLVRLAIRRGVIAA